VKRAEADLQRMANQIARAFAADASGDAAARLADHMHRFWSPLMRADLLAAINEGRIIADPAVAEACERGLI